MGNEQLFIATGVTDWDLLAGVKKEGTSYVTESVVVDSKTKTPGFAKGMTKG